MKKLFILFVFLLNGIIIEAQVIVDKKVFYQKNYNLKKFSNSKKLIGKRVKLYDTRIYTTINITDVLNWPNEEIRLKSGENAWEGFYPAIGDTGTIVFVFKYQKDFIKADRVIYLLNIKNHYVPVSGSGLTDLELLDRKQLADTLKNSEYNPEHK